MTTIEDPKFTAAIDMLRRTGMMSFQIRYSDDEDPVIWIAVGEWEVDGKTFYDTAAAGDPIQAVMRLLDLMIDGGTCTHCGRYTGVTEHWEGSMPLADVVCWQIWDPEMKKFRRSCEGESERRKTHRTPSDTEA